MPAALKMLKDVWKYGSSAGAGGVVSGSSTGNIPQRLTSLQTLVAAIPARNPFVPNFYDSWGFYADQPVTNTGLGGTDPALNSPYNLQHAGYVWSGSGAGTTIALGTGNPVSTAEWLTAKSTTGNVSGNYSRLFGTNPIAGQLRYVYPGIPQFSSASYPLREWVIEARLVLGSLLLQDVFIGIQSANDPIAAAVFATGAIFRPSQDASNWLAVNNNNGTVSYSAAIAAASTSAMQVVRARLTATSINVSINGGAETSLATNFPASQIMFVWAGHNTRTAASKDVYWTRIHDWVQ